MLVFNNSRDNFSIKYIDDQYKEFFEYYFQQNKTKAKVESNKNCEKDTAASNNYLSLDDFAHDSSNDEYEDALNEFEFDTDNNYNKNDNLMADIKAEEHLEFNGGIIKIRQSRVKAPMVKKAIALILSSKEVCFYFK